MPIWRTAWQQLLANQAARIPLPTSPTRPPASIPIVLLEQYDGNPDNCCGFLMQCGIYVKEHPEMFRTQAAEGRFVISLLTGCARE